MVKYSPSFKRKVIEEYLLNKPSYSKLSKKFKVSQSHIYEWIRLYEDRGEQFFKWKGHQKYSRDFKLSVLHYIENTGASDIDAVIKFSLRNSGSIRRWRKEFYPELIKTKGPSILKKVHSTKENKQLTKEQQLQREIELLKIEVDYLKKLQGSKMTLPSRLKN